MERVLINELKENESSKISGWADVIRDTKYMVFVILKDRSGSIQVSIDKEKDKEIVEKLSGILANSVLSFTGKMVKSEYVKQGGKEFLPEVVEVLSSADAIPIDSSANIDTRLDYRWIDLRSEKNNLMFQVQTAFVTGMREFLIKEDFTEIHTPKLIGAASESGSDVFEVKYFDRKAYLAQSPQFYKQMAMASGIERIFEVAPAFRAENSNTNRHTTEFTSFDLEFSYIDSYEDVMDMEERLLVAGLEKVKEKYEDKIKELFGTEVIVPKRPFPRINLQDLYKELESRYGYNIPEHDIGDMNAEAEKLTSKYAMEEFGHEFIFVTGFTKTKRAFYHMRKNDIPEGYDLIWRGTEITTGAQREHRYEILKQQAEEKGLGRDVEFYLEFFKYGCPPHGGFAIGVDRLTMLLLGLPSLKEEMFIFRGPSRLTP
ncbi:MAG: aspartate--tRNA(Asn) ligase [Bacilli bacterium]|jgi:nondiscriminating aspartyl-tRNA synthetase|nr:aspartate--tRNA(Asn) ligase [Bacilli bacterium]